MAEILRDPSSIVPVWEQHGEIVRALFDGRTDDAAEILERHIKHSYQSIISAADVKK